VNALANDEVGKYLNDHFVSSFQKVGTFRIVNGQKQGGNVASYFCLSDGSVLHAVAGPVDAAVLLREARWVIETRKLARATSHGDYGQYQEFFRKAHADRLRHEYRVTVDPERLAKMASAEVSTGRLMNRRGCPKGLPLQGQVHYLLASLPLVKIEQVYPVVFEKILGERISTLPVQEG
jgi:hypothetical protein